SAGVRERHRAARWGALARRPPPPREGEGGGAPPPQRIRPVGGAPLASHVTHEPPEEDHERKTVGMGAPLCRQSASYKAQSAYPTHSARGCLFAITSRSRR